LSNSTKLKTLLILALININESVSESLLDDNKNNLFTLRTLINEHIEANIIEADSGQGALDVLLLKPVDLIILDVQMPEMDGFETAKLIRSFKKTRHIPIVFLTAAYKSAEFQQKTKENSGTQLAYFIFLSDCRIRIYD
jgi:CheY-like chemotaxis protein